MKPAGTYVITGAAGFIASYLVGFLNRQGFENLILVDDFSKPEKQANLTGKKYLHRIDRKAFFNWIADAHVQVDGIFHLGARTDTTEMDYEVHRVLNLEYSQHIWKLCVARALPLVYASSAATYGDGEHGYSDTHEVVPQLHPLNPYGQSKNDFDQWALTQTETPPFWAGVKFFNVFGPNEYHKDRMASVIFHAFRNIQKQGFMQLFRSHRPEYTDGGQLRDFIYVADIVSICFWLMNSRPNSGLYNGGTGIARSFNDLANAVFAALGTTPDIRFIDTPEDIRDRYQYFTEADTQKLRAAGYDVPFQSLEAAIEDYVTHYLSSGSIY
ncbi:MAG: ADP-glyceromanno-heptose 6-epimerase [Sphingobacteriales bacterium]|nr:MAG: ADP-glyceromanno-heptose 6-epimerase [Sphingobacteriales bacterium]